MPMASDIDDPSALIARLEARARGEEPAQDEMDDALARLLSGEDDAAAGATGDGEGGEPEGDAPDPGTPEGGAPESGTPQDGTPEGGASDPGEGTADGPEDPRPV